VAEGCRNGDYHDSYTPTEAARILCVSPTRVRQLLRDGELSGERDGAGHWLIPARAVHDRVERLCRETFLEAVGFDPLRVRALQERVEILQREVGRLEGHLESEEKAHSTLETDRILLVEQLERERRRARELHAELDVERSKGFWQRLFGR
jgi:excisionase family DNA binding protein